MSIWFEPKMGAGRTLAWLDGLLLLLLLLLLPKLLLLLPPLLVA